MNSPRSSNRTAPTRCDAIIGDVTCRNEHSDPSGLCFSHRYHRRPALVTLRDLRSVVEAAKVCMQYLDDYQARKIGTFEHGEKTLRKALEALNGGRDAK